MEMKFIYLILAIFLSFSSSISAEIDKVTVTWTSVLCRDACGQLLYKQFSKIKGVSSVEVNQQAGIAYLKWKENVKFSFAPVNLAMQMVGLGLRDIRISVTGTVRATGKYFSIISLGDNTEFYLLSPVTPQGQGYVNQFNTANRQLSPEMEQKLFNAQNERKIVTIEGPLFMPWRSPILYLVIANMSVKETPSQE